MPPLVWLEGLLLTVHTQLERWPVNVYQCSVTALHSELVMNCMQQYGMGFVWGILPLKATLLCNILTAVYDEKSLVTSKILANTEQMLAVCSALVLASNPWRSASSLSKEEAQQKAFDFKLRLLEYYFHLHPLGLPPPGPHLLQPAQHSPSFTMQCMISRLHLDSSMIAATHLLPKTLFAVSFKFCMCSYDVNQMHMWRMRLPNLIIF